MYKNFSHIYFLGIGGIGMSALALYFFKKGIKVSGYDRTTSPITNKLINEGINIHFQEYIDLLENDIDIVIYTPAIPVDNIEFVYFKEKGIQMLKRAEALAMITENNFTVAVAGTHGKTSITAMISHILSTAGKQIDAFIGGIANNFESNIVIAEDNPEMIIVEADEYDRSFLNLKPDMAVISSIDADHLDIYGNYNELSRNFCLFIDKIKSSGCMILKDVINIDINNKIDVYKYSVNYSENIDFCAFNINLENGRHIFNLKLQNEILENVFCGALGLHNVENAVAASAIAYNLSVEPNIIKSALANYKGVSRRFDFRINTSDIVFVDDYAHHPSEIKACLNSLKQIFPTKRLTAIFQPHLFSRTRDFADDFAKSLQIADEVILLDIYPAREKPITGVSSTMLLSKINGTNKILLSKDELIDYLKTNTPELLVTMGAGDIDRLVKPLEIALIEIFNI